MSTLEEQFWWAIIELAWAMKAALFIGIGIWLRGIAEKKRQ